LSPVSPFQGHQAPPSEAPGRPWNRSRTAPLSAPGSWTVWAIWPRSSSCPPWRADGSCTTRSPNTSRSTTASRARCPAPVAGPLLRPPSR